MTNYGYCQSELCWGTAGPITEAEVRKVLQTIKDLGGSRVRMAVQLGTVAELDRAVLLSHEYGLQPLLCLINNPALGYAASVESFGTMCLNVATRYGPMGAGPLKNTITELELTNEPNSSLNAPGVDPATFVKYLKAGHQAIKSVFSSCTVIAGGTIPAPDTWIPFIGVAYNPVAWYTQILAAGGGQWFDAWAAHLYADMAPSPTIPQWKYLTDIRALMVANGFGGKKCWVTEVGVGFPAPGVSSLLQARDWLKIMIDGITGYDWMGPFFIFNARNYSGGDGTGGSYGMVDINFVPREPLYSYAKTIRGASPSTPSTPTGLMYGDVTSNSANFTWDPNPSADGVTNYRLKTPAGVLLADTQQTHRQLQGLPAGTPQSFTVTAVNGAGIESAPSSAVSLATNAPAGLQADFAYTFAGSIVPTTLAQLGLGFSVSSGIALPNASAIDGKFITVAPYWLDMQSPDHSSRVSLAAVAGAADRTALAIVRSSADGTQWMAAGSPGGGNADSLVIYMFIGGKLVRVAAMNIAPASAYDDLLMTVAGNVYTAQIISPGATVRAERKWTDLNGIYPGATNRRAGLGWLHTRSKSINYPPPGITKWAAADVGPIHLSGGAADVWSLALLGEDDGALALATRFENTLL